jgi:yecA family protein
VWNDSTTSAGSANKSAVFAFGGVTTHSICDSLRRLDADREAVPDEIAALKEALSIERAKGLEIAAELAVAHANASEDEAPIAQQKLQIAKLRHQIALSTMADAVGSVCAWLDPLLRRLEAHVMAGERLHADDTTVPVLAKCKTDTGRCWIYVSDDRPFGSAGPPAAMFHDSRDHRGEHPQAHLAGCAGILQAAAYDGYNQLYLAGRKPRPIQAAACWVHVRRSFFAMPDIEENARRKAAGNKEIPPSPIAIEVVRRIDALFEIERSINGKSPEERLRVPQTLNRPLVEVLQVYMREQLAKLSRGHDLAKAFNYILKRWASFTLFLEDGRVCLSNNAAERGLRGIALGRKSWLFCGSDRGGRRTAAMYSLIVTAKMNGVDPQAWLTDILTRTQPIRLVSWTSCCPGIGALMSGLSRRLKQLDEELLALGDEAMLLEELDGFIAGLLVCPELIMPNDWLPVVWQVDSSDQQSVFENLDHASRVLDLVMEHYNSVARTLMEHPDRYSPLFSVDVRNDDILWEVWIEGFERAFALRPTAWNSLLDADVDTAAAMSGMLLLVDVARGEKELDDRDPILAAAPQKIADWVVVLSEWRLVNTQPVHEDPRIVTVPRKKVGRNNPCPCGSGKKYKKCCGLN